MAFWPTWWSRPMASLQTGTRNWPKIVLKYYHGFRCNHVYVLTSDMAPRSPCTMSSVVQVQKQHFQIFWNVVFVYLIPDTVNQKCTIWILVIIHIACYTLQKIFQQLLCFGKQLLPFVYLYCFTNDADCNSQQCPTVVEEVEELRSDFRYIIS